MKHIYKFLFISILFSSCISTRYINIDVYEPATITFDSTIVNVLIANNTPSTYQQHITYNDDSEKELSIINDSAKWMITKSLAQFMDEEKYFGSVGYYNFQLREDTLFDKDIPLNKKQIAELCELTQTDAIISLDKVVISASIEKVNNFDYTYNDILELKSAALLRVYNADGEMLQPKIIIIDSLYWQGYSTIRNIIEPLPPFKNATMEAAVHLADKLVNFFIPHWQTTLRYYYSSSKGNMKKADKAAQSGNWAEAENYWTALFEKDDNILRKARLASNIALANECQNNLENAKKWIDISFNLIPEHGNLILANNTTVYREELARRINNKEKLDKQIGNN